MSEGQRVYSVSEFDWAHRWCVSLSFLLIVENGMEAVGVVEINARTALSAIKLSRIIILPVSTVSRTSDCMVQFRVRWILVHHQEGPSSG